jgi:hypothetical protein
VPNDEIIIIKPKQQVITSLSTEDAAAALRAAADALESGEMEVSAEG